MIGKLFDVKPVRATRSDLYMYPNSISYALE
jgi:hypothetical protein